MWRHSLEHSRFLEADAATGSTGDRDDEMSKMLGFLIDLFRQGKGVHISMYNICISPPVRWGLLDFMSVSSPPSRPPSPPPPRPPPPVVLLLLRSCEFSVACRTSTAILWVQCGVLDPNRDPASSVWRAGPQPRPCEFSVASRTPTAILWVQCGVPDLKYCVRKFVRKNDRRYVRKNDRRYVRRYVKKICQKICQKECQKICQKICQKECQKICQKECQTICQKEW